MTQDDLDLLKRRRERLRDLIETRVLEQVLADLDVLIVDVERLRYAALLRAEMAGKGRSKN